MTALACGLKGVSVEGTVFKNEVGDEFVCVTADPAKDRIELAKFPAGKPFTCDVFYHEKPYTRDEAEYYATGDYFDMHYALCVMSKTKLGHYRFNTDFPRSTRNY